MALPRLSAADFSAPDLSPLSMGQIYMQSFQQATQDVRQREADDMRAQEFGMRQEERQLRLEDTQWQREHMRPLQLEAQKLALMRGQLGVAQAGATLAKHNAETANELLKQRAVEQTGQGWVNRMAAVGGSLQQYLTAIGQPMPGAPAASFGPNDATVDPNGPASSGSVPVTYFSTGAAAGGPDEVQDKWTNKGYSATGKNLTEGIAAVNTSKYPLGTIFKDEDTGEVFIAADKHGNDDPNVVDLYKDPANYQQKKENRSLSVIGRERNVPKDAAGVQSVLDKYRATQPAAPPSQNANAADPTRLASSVFDELEQGRAYIEATTAPNSRERAQRMQSYMDLETTVLAQPGMVQARQQWQAQRQTAADLQNLSVHFWSQPPGFAEAFTLAHPNIGLRYQEDGSVEPFDAVTEQPLTGPRLAGFLNAWKGFSERAAKDGLPQTTSLSASPEAKAIDAAVEEIARANALLARLPEGENAKDRAVAAANRDVAHLKLRRLTAANPNLLRYASQQMRGFASPAATEAPTANPVSSLTGDGGTTKNGIKVKKVE